MYLTQFIRNAYKKNGAPMVKGLRIRPKNKLEGYIKRRYKEEMSNEEKKNFATMGRVAIKV